MIDNLGILILAAGSSRRFGSENKLLSNHQGQPLLQHTLACAQNLKALERGLVTGHDQNRVMKLARNFTGTVIHNPDHTTGMGSSIACGVKAFSPDITAIMILLGDMPDIAPALCEQIIRAYEGHITRPIYQGKPGHPVIFPARFRSEMENLSGDMGAMSIIKQHPKDIQFVETDDPACLKDVDYSSSSTT